ncbi:MAG: MFS transporter [Ferrimicrobium sp.]|uniref:MFS transporter n=1 Tax=Ferrimicrobium acidiphilum TaxID=121039 RepID=A0ABV3Y5K8_9ACTN|nr:MFS transporter [Ferrimicrobium sp.]
MSTFDDPDVQVHRQLLSDDARLVGMTWTHMINDGATNYLPGVLPAVLLNAREPLSLAGSLIAALAIGQALQPLIGWISDRVGGRSILIVGFGMTTVGGAFLGETHSMAMLIALLLAIGIGTSLFHPQALAAVRSITSGRRGLRTAFFLVGGELGRGLWPTLASLVVVHLGLGYLWIVGVPGLLTIGLLFRIAPSLTPVTSTRSVAVQAPWFSRLRPLATLILYSGLRAFAVFGLVTFVPVLWHIRGDGLVSGASVITTILVIGIVGNLGGGHLTDRFGKRVVLVGSSLAVAALVVPMGYAHGLSVWIIAGLLGCVLFMTLSTTILIGQEIFPENPSLGSGIALGLANAIGAVMVLAVSLAVGKTDIHAAFVAMGAASLLSVLAALAFPRALMHSDMIIDHK